MTDCLIVGGGIIGMLSARELAHAGVQITLLEKGETGREASWAGGGILSPLHPWQAPDAITALAQWSQHFYPELAQQLLSETGIDPEWTQSGMLILMDAAQQAVNQGSVQCDTAPLARLDAQAILALEPQLNVRDKAALWMPHIAQIRSPRLAQACKASLLAQGVVIKEGVEAVRFMQRRERVVGVETTQGRFPADKVIVASGAWSAKLLEPTGLSLPVSPVRGQMVLLKGAAGLMSRIVVAGEHYIIPRRDGRVLVGSTVEQADFDKSTTGTALLELRNAALALVPRLAEYPVEHHWAGLRPSSPSGVPFIGPHPGLEGLYINAGHFRNGLVLAPASARLLADLLLGRPQSLDPGPYLPARLGLGA